MTNEEKAQEIVFGWADTIHEDACDAALEMAEWKDQQFKEYLEKKKEVIKVDREKQPIGTPKWSMLANMVVTIDCIINELFGETKQDNSDREE